MSLIYMKIFYYDSLDIVDEVDLGIEFDVNSHESGIAVMVMLLLLLPSTTRSECHDLSGGLSIRAQ